VHYFEVIVRMCLILGLQEEDRSC